MNLNSKLIVTVIAALTLSNAALAFDVKGTPHEGAISIEQIQEGAQEEGGTITSIEYVVVGDEKAIRVEMVEENGKPVIALLDPFTGEVSAMVDPGTGELLEEGQYEEEGEENEG